MTDLAPLALLMYPAHMLAGPLVIGPSPFSLVVTGLEIREGSALGILTLPLPGEARALWAWVFPFGTMGP